VTFADITERWRAEQERQRFAMLADSSSEFIGMCDLDFQPLYVNPAGMRMVGLPDMAAACRLKVQDYFFPEDRQFITDEFYPRVLREGHGDLEIRLRHFVTGQAIWMFYYLFAVRDASGTPVGWATVSHDITEHKRAEEARERLQTAIEQAGDMVVITNPTGAIEHVNPAFTAVTGYRLDEVIARNMRVLKSGRQDQAFYSSLWNTITGGGVWKGRMVNKRKDGTLFTDESTISPVKAADGKIINFVAVKRDISERLRMQEEKSALEDQLRQAQRMESVGRLAGGVAHDFNNILNVIIGYGEIAMGQLHEGDPLRANLREIVAAGERAATLTRQLLAFSRRQTLQPEVLDLNVLVENLDNMLRRLIGDDFNLRLRLSDAIHPVLADPGQVEQVIMNLVVNARDAMPSGGTLTIETANAVLDETYCRDHADVEAGEYVLLAIADTGSGMDEETLSRIFEPFFTTKEKGRGTGLGLATVYGIVKQSGGHIWVYSELGQGTTFKIYLPRTCATPDSSVGSVETAPPTGGNEQILVVEDNESLRNLAAAILSNYGYKVTSAANGGEALLLMEEKGLKPHLILTDVIMPNMGGKELIDRLRRTEPGLRVLYMSGYPEDAIAERGVVGPAAHFIQKPFSVEALLSMVRSVLEET